MESWKDKEVQCGCCSEHGREWGWGRWQWKTSWDPIDMGSPHFTVQTETFVNVKWRAIDNDPDRCCCCSLSCVWLLATPGTAACQASLSITNSWSLLKLMSMESVMPMESISSSVCHPFLLLLSIFPRTRVVFFPPISHFFTLGGQSIGASASTPILPMYIQGWFPLGLTGLISLLSKGLSSLLRHHGLKVSVIQCSAFFIVQLSHLYRKINHNYSWQTRACAPLIDHASDFGLHPKNNVNQGLSLVMGMRAASWKDLPGYTVRTGMAIVSLNTESPS